MAAPIHGVPLPHGHTVWLTLLEWSERWGTDPVPLSKFCQTFYPGHTGHNHWNILNRLRRKLLAQGFDFELLQENAPYPAYSLTRPAVDHVYAYFHAWDTARRAHEADNPELLNAAQRDLFRLNKPHTGKPSPPMPKKEGVLGVHTYRGVRTDRRPRHFHVGEGDI